MSEKQSSNSGAESSGENGHARGRDEETSPDSDVPALPDVSGPEDSQGAAVCPSCGAEIPPGAPQGLCPKCALAGAAAPTDADSAGGRSRSGPRFEPPEIETIAAAFPLLEIVELIGCGGMGAVYKARQPHLDRFVALKILPPSLAETQGFTERFTREGRLLAKLSHPAIVGVHDFGQAGGFFYLLMEYVDGVNLRQAMRAGRFTPEQALGIVPKVCEALQFAHDEGVLHRDIKPENILLDSRGTVKIADFGIAKLLDEVAEVDPTLTGSMAPGTPHYMAPEQIEQPGTVDHRADIYSLGVVFYEMLTGELPIGRFAAPSEKTAVDSQVDEIVLRSLEKERDRRQQSATEVKTQIEGMSAKAITAERHPGYTIPAGSKTDSPRNPWMRRLLWLGLLILAMPFVSVAFYFLSKGTAGPGGSLMPGFPELVIIGAIVGFFGFLFWLLIRRPRAADPVPVPTQDRQESSANPWPRRIFWLLIMIFVVPTLLIVVALLLPWLAFEKTDRTSYSIQISEVAEVNSSLEIRLHTHRYTTGNLKVEVHYEGPDFPGGERNSHDQIFPGQGQEWNLDGKMRNRVDVVKFVLPDHQTTHLASEEVTPITFKKRGIADTGRVDLFDVEAPDGGRYRAWIEVQSRTIEAGSGMGIDPK